MCPKCGYQRKAGDIGVLGVIVGFARDAYPVPQYRNLERND
jgi:hypothetical protein